MNRQERLKYCKVCSYQRFNTQKGIICSLTNAPAEFEVSCTTYKEDPELKHKADMEAIRNQLYAQEASKLQRIINRAVDIFCIVVTLVILLNIIDVINVFVLGNTTNSFNDTTLENYLWAYFATFLYYFLFESLTGRTIGKIFTQTKVINTDGERPAVGTIFIRTLSRLVPFDAWSFVFTNYEGWHDAWSKTKVVSIK
ncbi:RDD family protein [Carboxylicivirga sp. A043]|uniref:RDD family protein n=1 Tax=Carboxylicivirga litoralis TaxID=2816963 RepID=UPI0021CB8DF6|nr:RDD family protein [Carboxylicivirga sp. A043]MCU4158120.1 RDD family protein [Carboxylicivirga sp. A043]